MPEFDRQAFLKEAEAVVLRGLAKGYASGAKATPVPGKPGWKYYEYAEGPWYLRDEYYVDPVSKKSCGYVVLEHDSAEYPNRLVWFMAYGGFYKKEAIPCLKGALMERYSAGVFNCGRGRLGYTDGTYVYAIQSQGKSSFERFFAHESVMLGTFRDYGGTYYEDAGGHEVWGMALV